MLALAYFTVDYPKTYTPEKSLTAMLEPAKAEKKIMIFSIFLHYRTLYSTEI